MSENDFASRLAELRRRVASAAHDAGRLPAEVTIVGVGKLHPAEAVAEVVGAGLKDVGENRVQEAAAKRPAVERLLADLGMDPNSVRWHLIGHLQSNKAAKAVALFDVVQSVESVELARRLGEAAGRLGKLIECYVQVNTSGEATKFGSALDTAQDVAEAVVAESSLRLAGLMTIGPLTDEELPIRSSFNDLRKVRDRLEAVHPEWGRLGLSMGMSGDYPLAIAAGATVIRIGTALFGERDPVTGPNEPAMEGV